MGQPGLLAVRVDQELLAEQAALAEPAVLVAQVMPEVLWESVLESLKAHPMLLEMSILPVDQQVRLGQEELEVPVEAFQGLPRLLVVRAELEALEG